MKNLILLLILCFFHCSIKSQEFIWNMDFEEISNNMPVTWYQSGNSPENYLISVDSLIKKSGKYAVSIERIRDTTILQRFSTLLKELKNYDGKKITLSGYIKTENVTGGHAGLFMKIDPDIASDNMREQKVRGTTDWTRYEITLDMNPENTQKILIGAILTGKGKMWVDNLEVSIDGEKIQNLKSYDTRYISSTINEFNLNKSTIENLKVLGLIWGFVKYYHPNVAKGKYDMDNELFNLLPTFLKSENVQERDRILIEWIKNFGNFANREKSSTPNKNIKLLPDLEWIEKYEFSSELATLLNQIKNAKRPESHHYFLLTPGARNPIFKNENSYTSLIFPNPYYQLLALYRYWNTIQYFFPYKYLIEEDWKDVLEEFIPKIIKIKDREEYVVILLELISRIHDTHANLVGAYSELNNYYGKLSAPIKVEFIENYATITGFYKNTFPEELELYVGDIILEINNKPVEDIIKERIKYTSASNYPTQLSRIANNLLRTNETSIHLKVKQGNQIINKTIPTQTVGSVQSEFRKQSDFFRFITNDIGYIYIGRMDPYALDYIFKHLKDSKGLIIDLRVYPSNSTNPLWKYILNQPKEFAKFTNTSITQPGLFTFTKSEKAGIKNLSYYKGKVVILIDHNTGSHGEYTAMALKTGPNVTIIGSTTAAADGNISKISLPGKLETIFSGIGVYYPDGTETQRIGIVPDIEVKPTIQGIRQEQDDVLEKAIEIINREK